MDIFDMGYRGADFEAIGIIAFILALSCAIVSFILLLPEKRRASLNGFFKVVADIFNFKDLLLEKILKFLYIFSTMYVIIVGFFTMFVAGRGEYMLIEGLATMLVAPIILRVFYEFIMMFILLVKNTNDINKKMTTEKAAPSAEKCEKEEKIEEVPVKAEVPVTSEAAAEEARVCPLCGAAVKSSQSAFCQKCGHKL